MNYKQKQNQIEPDERWKAQLRRRIDENLDQLLSDAKRSYEEKVHATGPADDTVRRRLYFDYLQSVQNLKSFARDEYDYAIERERQEMEWCMEAQVSSSVGFGDDDGLDGFESEALKEEQYLMLNKFHMELAKARAKAEAIENPTETSGSEGEDVDDADEDEEDERDNDDGEGEDDDDDDDEEGSDRSSESVPGTPVVIPLDAQFKAHAEELTRLLSATPSPPPSPSLPPSPLPLPFLDLSPPATPPLTSEDTGSSAESSIIFTPQRSVIDEEARLRAEKHAKQQEEFHRRAEEIKKKNEEKKKQKQKAVEEEEIRVAFSTSAPPSAATSTTTGSLPSSSRSSSSASFWDDIPRRRLNNASSSSASSSPPPLPSSPSFSFNEYAFFHPDDGGMSEEDMIRIFIFHDQQWDRISSFQKLRWSDFPWPVLSFTGPKSEGDITFSAVSRYILSAFDWQQDTHGQDKARTKERLREHIRKWHPDRFEVKFLHKVTELDGEREKVRQGAGLVVRSLNELLGKWDNL